MINELIEQIGGRERLEKIASWSDVYGRDANVMLPASEAEAMASALLAVMDAQEKPAAYIISDKKDREAGRRGCLSFTGVNSYSAEDISEYELCQTPLHTVPPAASVPEWSNAQCMEFLTVAFRHCEISGDIEMDDIRLGVKMANAAAPGGVDG